LRQLKQRKNTSANQLFDMARRTDIIIGLTGKKRSGKTTAANYLCSGYDRCGYQAARLGISDYLKNKMHLITGPLTDEEKCQVRVSLQNLADFFKSRHGSMFFVEQWLKSYQEMRERGVNVFIIDDVRYPYEAEFIRDRGGEVIRIKRPETDSIHDTHSSETSVDEIVPDHMVEASDVAALTQQLTRLFGLHHD